VRQILLLLFFSVALFGVDPEVAKRNAQIYGVFTLIPPVVAIALAFITKDVILSLFIGVFSGTFLINIVNENVFMGIIKGFTGIVSRVVDSMADKTDSGILLQVRGRTYHKDGRHKGGCSLA